MAKNNTKKQYLVVGLGRFGSAIAETLCEAGEEVLGVDDDLELVENMRDRITHTVQMDAMDRSALMALGVQDFDVAFVTMGSDIRASGMITLLMKELGVKRVIAKAHDEFHGRMLEKLGADEVCSRSVIWGGASRIIWYRATSWTIWSCLRIIPWRRSGPTRNGSTNPFVRWSCAPGRASM